MHTKKYYKETLGQRQADNMPTGYRQPFRPTQPHTHAPQTLAENWAVRVLNPDDTQRSFIDGLLHTAACEIAAQAENALQNAMQFGCEVLIECNGKIYLRAVIQ